MKKITLLLTILFTVAVSQNYVDYNDLVDEDVATIDEEIFSAVGDDYSFAKSKRLLATKVYSLYKKAFYSNCDFTIKERMLVPIHKSCGFKYRKNKKRSKRIEWEHIVPAWEFGHELKCWKKGGRRECRRDKYFRQMESDMHNLVPAIGEINGDRSNFRYGKIRGERRVYGRVDMEIDFNKKVAEPKKNLYGDIARSYFYMRDKYGMKIDKAQEKMLVSWNNIDPVTRWEKKRNQIIKKLQGDDNPYITNYKKIENLESIDYIKDVKVQRESDRNGGFMEVQNELANKYAPFLNHFSKPVATIILIIMTLFVLYRRKSK